ncbi:MAG: glycosyltransferase family 4 protein [Chloroflexi bacterium]|nr:glycosyltransferase family 4 protein [Chloroflexota bacterium]
MPLPLRVLGILVIDNMIWDTTVPVDVTADLAESLERLDYIVYSPLSSDLRPRVISDRLTVYPSRSRSKLSFLQDAYLLGRELNARHAYNLIWTDDPMGAGLVGYRLKRALRVPQLIKVHSDYYSSRAWRSENPRYILDYYLSLWMLRRADRVQAVSEAIAHEVERIGVARERITVLPTLMRWGDFGPGPDTRERYAAGQLLFAGRLVPAKRVDVLIGALGLLHARGYRPRLVVAGRGPLRESLEEQCRQLGLTPWVTFAGHLPLDELGALYQHSSIFVLPSAQEAFGKVLAEAGLSGLPLVATRVSGIPELVADGDSGLLVPPDDARSLADALARLLDDPDLTQRMGREARRRLSERLSFARAREAYLEMLTVAAQSGGGVGGVA